MGRILNWVSNWISVTLRSLLTEEHLRSCFVNEHIFLVTCWSGLLGSGCSVCYFTNNVSFYTQCVILHTVCNLTHSVTQNIDLRCFFARQFLSQIYAFLSVKCSGLKICYCKKKRDKYQVCKVQPSTAT